MRVSIKDLNIIRDFEAFEAKDGIKRCVLPTVVVELDFCSDDNNSSVFIEYSIALNKNRGLNGEILLWENCAKLKFSSED